MAIAAQGAHERFLRRAIELATDCAREGRGGPFGALVVRDGRIVGTGVNSVVALHDPTAHAEMQAVRAACAALGTHRLEECDLYASCEPCPMCLGAAYWAHLRAVYFAGARADADAAGFDDARFHAEVARAPGERTVRLVQLLADEGRRPFAAWLANPHRLPY